MIPEEVDMTDPMNEFYRPENCNHRSEISGAPCVRNPGHDPGHYYDYPGC